MICRLRCFHVTWLNKAQDSSRAFCCLLRSHTIVERLPNCFLKQLFIQPKVMNWSLLPRFYRYCPPFIPSVVFAFNTTYQPTHRSLFTFHLIAVFVCHVFPKSNKSTCLNPQKIYKRIYSVEPKYLAVNDRLSRHVPWQNQRTLLR